MPPERPSTPAGDRSEALPGDLPETLPDALARARRTRVVVVGGGVAGLTAALEWAKVGAHVTVVEASQRFGGGVETVVLDGIAVDLVADAFPLGAAPLRDLLDELLLRDAVEPARAQPVWVAGLPATPGGAAPLPVATLLGIPANTWADDVRRIIGWRGVWRAYLDRLRPPLTIGFERRLGALVRKRMGDRVADLLVAPTTRGLYDLSPDEIDVEAAAPGLSTALTRAGSLSGAVTDLLPAAEDAAAQAPTRATLRGRLSSLPDALVARLTDLGADLRVATRAVALVREDERWEVALDADAAADQAALAADQAAAAVDAGDTAAAPADVDSAAPLPADVVIVATGAGAARTLLGTAGIAVDVAAPQPSRRDVVTLIVAAPALDDAPRGRSVYPVAATAESSSAAVAVDQPTAEWPSLAASAAELPGRHVLRVALPADPDRTDEAVVALAAAQASALLGVDVGTPRAAARRTVEVAPPASALGHADRAARVRAAVARQPGLGVVGAWVSGSGLAHVVADAVAEVDRARGVVLWGRATDRR